MVKGYARVLPEPWFVHWWTADEEGRVVDPTWRNRGTAYVGVEVVHPWLSEFVQCLRSRFGRLSLFAPDELVDRLNRLVAGEPERLS
jgi:hypothetical protein